VSAIPTGAYWYIRNALVSGNPLFPSGDPALGYPAETSTTSLLGNSDPARWGMAWDALWSMTGPCHVAAVAVAPAVLVWLLVMATWSLRPRVAADVGGWEFFAVAWLLAGSFAVFLATPFAVEDQPGTLNHLRMGYTPARYGLCFLSTALISFAWLVSHVMAGLRESRSHARQSVDLLVTRPTLWRAWLRLVAAAVIAGGVVWQVVLRLRHSWYESHVLDTLLVAGNLALWTAIVWMIAEGWSWIRGRNGRIATLAAAAGLIAWCTSSLSARWHAGFDAHFNRQFSTTMFGQLAPKLPPDRRLCVLDLRPYAFFGSRRDIHVCRPRHVPSWEWLVDYLRENRLTLVVGTGNLGLTHVFDIYQPASGWLREHPDLFTAVFEGAQHTLYSVQPNLTVIPGQRDPPSNPNTMID
jgi:hypothetical protein